MSWFDELMEYSKDSFRILKNNKALFIPYGGLLLLKLVMFGLLIFITILITKDLGGGRISPEDFLSYTNYLPQIILGSIGLGVFALLIISFFEAGTSAMFFMAVKGETVRISDFWEGGRYFFKRFLGGNLLLIFGGLFLSPILIGVFIVVGIFTLGLGFFILPLLIGVFLGMWKVSIVANDNDILTALKNSIRFGKDYFWPFLFVNFIVTLTKGFFSAGDGGKSNGLSQNPEFQNPQGIPSYFANEGIKWLIGLSGAIFSFIFVAFSIVKMIFDIFFDCYYFVFYMHKRAQI